MASMDMYVAPITLGFTPADGDFIRGTVNGVEVSGEWDDGVALYKGALDVSTYGSAGGQRICIIGISDGQAVVVVQQDSTPTTDYELHLYRYTPADIVQIPQEYVEGLKYVAENANAAKTAAETAQSTANSAKTAAETAQSTANDALTKKNGGISKGVIGGSMIKALHDDLHYANLNYQGLYFYHGSNTKTRSIINSDGYSVFGDIDTKHVALNPNIGSSVDAKIHVANDDTNSVSITANGEIDVFNPDETMTLYGPNALVVKFYTDNGLNEFKITIGDDARPTFANTRSPYNTWTPGENLPAVTASDSGKFLRVSSTGAWEAETTVIPSQPIIVDAEADMSTGSLQISSEDDIQKMNAIDAAYKAGKPCSAYLRYLVNDSYIWCALIATIASSDLCNFLFASSIPNNLIRVVPSTNGNWMVSIDGPTDDSK